MLARVALHGLVDQLRIVRDEVVKVEKRILAHHRADDASRRLATIPGIGPITASAIAAAVPDATLFKSGRQFAAWLGLAGMRPAEIVQHGVGTPTGPTSRKSSRFFIPGILGRGALFVSMKRSRR
jgi:transposase